jgi:hypothetical protein
MLTTAAKAEQPNRVLPPATRIDVPGEPQIELSVHHFLINRTTVDNANAAARAKARLDKQLKECRKQLLIEEEPSGSTKVWWVAIGGAAGAAFVLGYLAGTR